MNTSRKFIAASLIVTALMSSAIHSLSPAIPQAGPHHILHYEQTDAATKTLYLVWPGYFGATRIPLFTSSRERQQRDHREPEAVIARNAGRRTI